MVREAGGRRPGVREWVVRQPEALKELEQEEMADVCVYTDDSGGDASKPVPSHVQRELHPPVRLHELIQIGFLPLQLLLCLFQMFLGNRLLRLFLPLLLLFFLLPARSCFLSLLCRQLQFPCHLVDTSLCFLDVLEQLAELIVHSNTARVHRAAHVGSPDDRIDELGKEAMARSRIHAPAVEHDVTHSPHGHQGCSLPGLSGRYAVR
mmetsp:Transcript_8618/g.19511  ORF Transcript_8618/g.19511 Transcript_8618/m.19511 type:complete len:207 (-) Transcript_8618:1113-1733(-)